MTEADQLKILRTSSEVRRLLEKEFDFSPGQNLDPSPLFHLREDMSCEVIAKTKSGCLFCLCQNGKWTERPLLFVSSEGQAGVIGKNLSDGLSVLVALPFWEDCLKFSGGGQLAEMRRTVPLLESESRDVAGIDLSRKILRTQLGLESLTDPVQSLFRAVTELSPSIPVFGKDDWKFDTLFNTFTVESNPSWRGKLSGSA